MKKRVKKIDDSASVGMYNVNTSYKRRERTVVIRKTFREYNKKAQLGNQFSSEATFDGESEISTSPINNYYTRPKIIIF